METIQMKIIAKYYCDLPEKFGLPRQSGMVEDLKGKIVFEPEYRNADALRGLEGYSHIWLLWQFSKAVREEWSPTVRPPKLGGNKRMGVFATRSPFRPNPVGLSCVAVERIDLHTAEGPVIYVLGADLINESPIIDIKPYIPFADCKKEALGGFTEETWGNTLAVDFPSDLMEKIPKDKQSSLMELLALDPRPGYQNDEQRVYKMTYGHKNVCFRVEGERLIVVDIEEAKL